MPTGKQIRAARVLLDWNVEDLSAHAGVNRESILHAERGERRTRAETMDKITRALNVAGVEFLENNGVRQHPEGIEVMNGQEGLSRFLDGVYEHLKEFGGKVMVTGVLDEQWTKYGGEHITKIHVPRMVQLCSERGDVEVFSLCPEGTHEFDYDSYTKYRSQPRELFDSVPFYVYGDNLAIIVFQSDPSPKIILIRSSVVAQAYKNQFAQLWSLAKEMPKLSDDSRSSKGRPNE